MLFVVIHQIPEDRMSRTFRRLRNDERDMPEGLDLIDTWVEADQRRSIQIIRCDRFEQIRALAQQWRLEAIEFHVLPVSMTCDGSLPGDAYINRIAGLAESVRPANSNLADG